jgi:DnaJ-class molecular chaperone
MNQEQVPLKSCCSACGGEGVLMASNRTFVLAGREHPLLSKCVACEGKGTILKWVDIQELAMLINAIAAEFVFET